MGLLFEALAASQYAENTIVVLWSDHGFHLGEKLRFGKATLWAESVKVPFIVRTPDMTKQRYCSRTVSLIDIYPTLIDLCALPKKELDGHNFSSLLENPENEWPYPGITMLQANRKTSVMTEDWHYIQLRPHVHELYDLKNDPMEWHNLANDPKHGSRITEFEKWIPKERLKALEIRGDVVQYKKQAKALDSTIKATRKW